MTNTKRLATIFVLTAILITGSLNAIQYAYSSGPDTLKVRYSGPIGVDPAETIIQIYKKIDDFSNPPLGPEIQIDADGEEFMVVSSNYGKDKLNSNTVFRVIERTSGFDDVEIDVIEIHTSCSKPLYKGQMVDGVNVIVTLEVLDGTLGSGDENSILPDNETEKCEDNKDSKHTATIILKKAITNDNGGVITDPAEFLPKIDGVDVSFGEPVTITAKEPHFITEADVPGYSFVLIAGDTDCPSMLGEEFTVKKNKEITCTIYNDDKFVKAEPGSKNSGLIFEFGSITFVDATTEGFCVDSSGPYPCIDFFGSNSHIIVPDIDPSDPTAQKITPTTLMLLTVIDIDFTTTTIGCQITGFDQSTTTGRNGFVIKCPELIPTTNQDTFNANFALIETCKGTIDPTTLECTLS